MTITLVSGLLPCLDRSRTKSEWMDFVRTLSAPGLPLVLYSDPTLIEEVQRLRRDVKGGLTLRSIDEHALRNGLWLHSRLQGLIDANADTESDQALEKIARLRALGWLHDESIFNPYRSDAFVWVDPLLTQEVQPAYIEELGALNLLEPLLDPMLLLAQCGQDNLSGFSDAIFGGLATALRTVNGAYWHAYATSIDQGEIPTFDSLMKILWKNLPEVFQRYNLQSNGLAGAFFSTLVTGSVQIESLKIMRLSHEK
jgi:hypothetical protein